MERHGAARASNRHERASTSMVNHPINHTSPIRQKSKKDKTDSSSSMERRPPSQNAGPAGGSSGRGSSTSSSQRQRQPRFHHGNIPGCFFQPHKGITYENINVTLKSRDIVRSQLKLLHFVLQKEKKQLCNGFLVNQNMSSHLKQGDMILSMGGNLLVGMEISDATRLALSLTSEPHITMTVRRPKRWHGKHLAPPVPQPQPPSRAAATTAKQDAVPNRGEKMSSREANANRAASSRRDAPAAVKPVSILQDDRDKQQQQRDMAASVLLTYANRKNKAGETKSGQGKNDKEDAAQKKKEVYDYSKDFRHRLERAWAKEDQSTKVGGTDFLNESQKKPGQASAGAPDGLNQPRNLEHQPLANLPQLPANPPPQSWIDMYNASSGSWENGGDVGKEAEEEAWRVVHGLEEKELEKAAVASSDDVRRAMQDLQQQLSLPSDASMEQKREIASRKEQIGPYSAILHERRKKPLKKRAPKDDSELELRASTKRLRLGSSSPDSVPEGGEEDVAENPKEKQSEKGLTPAADENRVAEPVGEEKQKGTELQGPDRRKKPGLDSKSSPDLLSVGTGEELSEDSALGVRKIFEGTERDSELEPPPESSSKEEGEPVDKDSTDAGSAVGNTPDENAKEPATGDERELEHVQRTEPDESRALKSINVSAVVRGGPVEKPPEAFAGDASGEEEIGSALLALSNVQKQGQGVEMESASLSAADESPVEALRALSQWAVEKIEEDNIKATKSVATLEQRGEKTGASLDTEKSPAKELPDYSTGGAPQKQSEEDIRSVDEDIGSTLLALSAIRLEQSGQQKGQSVKAVYLAEAEESPVEIITEPVSADSALQSTISSEQTVQKASACLGAVEESAVEVFPQPSDGGEDRIGAPLRQSIVSSEQNPQTSVPDVLEKHGDKETTTAPQAQSSISSEQTAKKTSASLAAVEKPPVDMLPKPQTSDVSVKHGDPDTGSAPLAQSNMSSDKSEEKANATLEAVELSPVEAIPEPLDEEESSNTSPAQSKVSARQSEQAGQSLVKGVDSMTDQSESGPGDLETKTHPIVAALSADVAAKESLTQTAPSPQTYRTSITSEQAGNEATKDDSDFVEHPAFTEAGSALKMIPIVEEDDKYLVTDFIATVFAQFRPCLNKSKRNDNIGMECIHCAKQNDGSFRIFPTSRLGKSIGTLRKHLSDCTMLPPSLSRDLTSMEEKQTRQYAVCPPNGQSEFLDSVWNRLQRNRRFLLQQRQINLAASDTVVNSDQHGGTDLEDGANKVTAEDAQVSGTKNVSKPRRVGAAVDMVEEIHNISGISGAGNVLPSQDATPVQLKSAKKMQGKKREHELVNKSESPVTSLKKQKKVSLTGVVQDSDRGVISEYMFTLMSQYRPFADGPRKRGLECIHCEGEPFRLSLSSERRLGSSVKQLHGHLTENCIAVSRSLRRSLPELEEEQTREYSKLNVNAQQSFFERVWKRIEACDSPSRVEIRTAKVSSPPALKPKTTKVSSPPTQKPKTTKERLPPTRKPKHVAPNHQMLVQKQDRHLVSGYVFTLMSQVQPYVASPTKLTGGLECKHCSSESESFRLFLSSDRRLASSPVAIYKHLMKACPKVPVRLQKRLLELKELQTRQYLKIKPTAQAEFFENIWNRLNNFLVDNLKESVAEESESNAQVPSSFEEGTTEATDAVRPPTKVVTEESSRLTGHLSDCLNNKDGEGKVAVASSVIKSTEVLEEDDSFLPEKGNDCAANIGCVDSIQNAREVVEEGAPVEANDVVESNVDVLSEESPRMPENLPGSNVTKKSMDEGKGLSFDSTHVPAEGLSASTNLSDSVAIKEKEGDGGVGSSLEALSGVGLALPISIPGKESERETTASNAVTNPSKLSEEVVGESLLDPLVTETVQHIDGESGATLGSAEDGARLHQNSGESSNELASAKRDHSVGPTEEVVAVRSPADRGPVNDS